MRIRGRRPEILIIGAGSSGLAAAVTAAEAGADVIVFDGNPEPGEKILATGNGRCNFTNVNCTSKDLMSSQAGFADKVYETFGADKAIRFFKSLGVLARTEDEGRVYPYSGQAVAIRAALVNEAERQGVQIITGTLVREIRRTEEGSFTVVLEEGEELSGDAVIIATGGRAGMQFGSTGDGYGFAKSMGHTLVSPQPALVPLVSDERFFKELKGVRAKGRVALFLCEKLIAEDEGEIQFTSSGLSGICIFNLSRYINREKTGYKVVLDLAPDIVEAELSVFIDVEIAKTGINFNDGEITKTGLDFNCLTGILNSKLAPVIAKLAGRFTGSELARRIKTWDIPVSGTKGWKEAQTTCGGVSTTEINSGTLESIIVPGLFFAGEVIDVDGRCGGYNLQWAWSSGHVAGKAATERAQRVLSERALEKC